MPTSPVEPVNGASNPPLRAQETARHGLGLDADANSADPRPSSARTSSVSLLTQALAPALSDDETNSSTPRLRPTTTARPSFLRDHGDSNISLEETSTEAMGMTIPLPAVVDVCTARRPDGTTSAAAWAAFFNDRPRTSLSLRGSRTYDGSRCRGTSLERTEKERRIEDVPKRAYPQNLGDTGMKQQQNTNSQQIPSELSGITTNPPIDGFRAQYRSWRHPGTTMEEKAWSIGGRDADGSPDGQVEKSIAEALAGIEPSNRSRKASHSLRYFREGLPEEHKKQTKSRGRSKERLNKSRLETVEDEPTPESDKSSFVSGPRAISTTSPSMTKSRANETSNHGYFDIPTNEPEEKDIPHPSLPAQLLEEIRKHHNLTPGAGKGSSFSRSIPVLSSEKEQAGNGAAKLANDVARETSESRPSSKHSEEDDEESGEEHISSALFVPHQAAHETPDGGRLSRIQSNNKSSGSDEPEQWLVEHQIPPRDVFDDQQAIDRHQASPVRPNKGSVSPILPISREPLSDRRLSQTDDDVASQTSSVTSVSEQYSKYSDSGDITGDESGITDAEFTPTDKKKGLFILESQKQHIHTHQQTPKAPLDAVELIPYRHQVGGHTTMWRFSKRAVCKQLNNRENEFYEKVERYHPQLLKFLPRYIGVLNVTFQKQQKRKVKKERSDNATQIQNGLPPSQAQGIESATTTVPTSPDEQPRVISQSLAPVQPQVPTVTVADNAHLIPKQFLQAPLQLAGPPIRTFKLPHLDTAAAQAETRSAPPSAVSNGDRPSLYDRSTVSWGATMVNKRLRNEVFGEAFLRRPIPVHRHKKPGSQRSLPSRGKPRHLRGAISESDLVLTQQAEGRSEPHGIPSEKSASGSSRSPASLSGLKPLTPIKVDSNSKAPLDKPGMLSAQDFDDTVEDTSGRSAPEPSTAIDLHGKKKRRYSSGGLRRKPSDVATGRGGLTYYEEADDAGYKGDGEDDVFKMDPEPSAGANPQPSSDIVNNKAEVSALEQDFQSAAPMYDGTSNGHLTDDVNHRMTPPLPRPANPKEAQTQTDSRVEYFLLLEDLTAGMKRPCIMDLKMGTRQYGVDANEKKQKSQRNKCAHTTSLDLGVRVCGLQVWDVSTQSYVFKDKYWGRDLKAGQEFQGALTRFLYDGLDNSSILKHIPTVIRKLSELEVLIRRLHGYRFYAASLLMFYDGDPEYDDDTSTDNSMTSTKTMTSSRREIDFKIADFANCVTPQDVEIKQRSCPPQHPNAADRGFLRGLRSLKKYFLQIEQDIREKERMKGRPIGGKNSSPDTYDGYYDDALAPTISEEDDGEVSC